MSNIVGIDLGTTFSALAVLNQLGKPEIVPNADGERITPSAIYFSKDEKQVVSVGKEALRQRIEDVSRSVRWVKRSMGEKEYAEKLAGRSWTPAELSALILRKLKDECTEQIGPISDAVITVPAYFDEVRRKATMDAGQIAGLNVVAIINEPTAAALYYASTQDVSGRIMVFDLGGGTFDVTVMDVAGTQIDIISSDGNHKLGGYDFDQKLVERFDREYQKAKGCSLYPTREARAKYEDEAELAKMSLSKRPRVKVVLEGLEGSLPLEIKREDFEEDISSYMATIDMYIEKVLDESKSSPSDITNVLLVGGSSRLPIIQSRLEKLFGFPPIKSVNLDECVALGAAIYAGIRVSKENPSRIGESARKELGKIQMTDVCTHSYGTICIGVIDEKSEQYGLRNDIILKKNTPLPCTKTVTYYTPTDGQAVINARVTQGEDSDPEYANILAEQKFELPANRKAGCPINVTYSYDVNQRMHCEFLDKESGRKLEMDIDMQEGKGHATVLESTAKVGDFIVD